MLKTYTSTPTFVKSPVMIRGFLTTRDLPEVTWLEGSTGGKIVPALTPWNGGAVPVTAFPRIFGLN
jgi:hypothetical protein